MNTSPIFSVFVFSFLMLISLDQLVAQSEFRMDFEGIGANRNNLMPPYDCWSFASMDIKANSHSINGASARSGQLSNSSPKQYRLETPVLNLGSSVSFSFNHRVTNTSSNPSLLIEAEDIATGQIHTLYNQSYTGTGTIAENLTLSLPPAQYRISFYPSSTGNSGSSRVYLDDIVISNTTQGENINGGSCTITPLPVEMVYFEGRAETEGNVLEWLTASEDGNDYFEVQRSTDGANFEVIGELQGAGTTAEPTHYRFQDDRPLPHAYYRLRQVDFDGSFEYSEIISVENENWASGKTEARVFPNPSAGRLNLALDVTEADAGATTVSIRNTAGTIVAQEEVQLQVGESQWRYDLSNQPAGLYVVELRFASGGRRFEKMLKQ